MTFLKSRKLYKQFAGLNLFWFVFQTWGFTDVGTYFTQWSSTSHAEALSELKGSGRFLIANINQLTVKKAFQNQFHNISHTADEDVAIVKHGLH